MDRQGNNERDKNVVTTPVVKIGRGPAVAALVHCANSCVMAFHVAEGMWTCGTSRHCDIRLVSDAIAQTQLRFRVRGHRIEIANVARDTAVTVDGAPLGEALTEVASGGHIRVGDDVLRVLVFSPGHAEPEQRIVAGSVAITLADGCSYVVPFERGPLSVGRSAECDIVLSGSFTSRQHASVDPRPVGVAVLDAGSINGVFIDGVKVCGMQVAPWGVPIVIGDNTLVFRQESPSTDVGREPGTMEMPVLERRAAPQDAKVVSFPIRAKRQQLAQLVAALALVAASAISGQLQQAGASNDAGLLDAALTRQPAAIPNQHAQTQPDAAPQTDGELPEADVDESRSSEREQLNDNNAHAAEQDAQEKRSSREQEKESEAVETEKSNRLSCLGTIRPWRRARLAYEASGTVWTVPARVGAAVSRGDVLVNVSSPELLKRLRKAQQWVKKQQRLHGLELALGSDVEMAKEEEEQARADYRTALLMAPFNGIVAFVSAKVGDLAIVGDEAVDLVDASRLWVECHVEADAAETLRVGRTALVQAGDRSWRAKISIVGLIPDADSGLVPVRVQMSGQIRRNLRAVGVEATVSFQGSTRAFSSSLQNGLPR